MAKPKAPSPTFNPEAFGKELRYFRKAAGYTSTKSFSKAIEERTGVYISPNTINVIERGEQDISVTHMNAMAITLEDDGTAALNTLRYWLLQSSPYSFYPHYMVEEEKEFAEVYFEVHGYYPDPINFSLIDLYEEAIDWVRAGYEENLEENSPIYGGLNDRNQSGMKRAMRLSQSKDQADQEEARRLFDDMINYQEYLTQKAKAEKQDRERRRALLKNSSNTISAQ